MAAAQDKPAAGQGTGHNIEPRKLSIEEIISTHSTILPWDRFSKWIYCITIVTFDIELGQAIEVSDIISKWVIQSIHLLI